VTEVLLHYPLKTLYHIISSYQNLGPVTSLVRQCHTSLSAHSGDIQVRLLFSPLSTKFLREL